MQMGADYYVAVHEADWPSVAAVNECIKGLNYPVRVTLPVAGATPFRDQEGTIPVEFEGRSIELEASVVQLSATEPFAYGLKVDGIKLMGADVGNFVPLDLNAKLSEIGVATPNFKDGDYVLTITFRSSIDEWRAGFLLMSALIRCSAGLGFEFGQGEYGRVDYADRLIRDAAGMKRE